MSAEKIKGRGAASQIPGRFADRLTEPDAKESAGAGAPTTILRAMKASGIISRNNSPDVPFDRSINPYQGCEHGCVYCYARPSHSYLDLSPGLDFETRIFYKPNALSCLLAAWEMRGYECRPITIGANTDPYQPAEKKLGITRQLLEAFLEHRHPVSLITKGTLVSRDLDLLADLARYDLVSVAISIPTMNNELKRVLEPRVPSAESRLRAITRLKDAGVPVSLLLAPVIPMINDEEIEAILERAADAGVGAAHWILLRLPHELRRIFTEWLDTHMPERAARVMKLLREASGGRDYDSRYGVRQRGRGPYARMIAQRFAAGCRRFGLNEDRDHGALDRGHFSPPGQTQLALGLD